MGIESLALKKRLLEDPVWAAVEKFSAVQGDSRPIETIFLQGLVSGDLHTPVGWAATAVAEIELRRSQSGDACAQTILLQKIDDLSDRLRGGDSTLTPPTILSSTLDFLINLYDQDGKLKAPSSD